MDQEFQVHPLFPWRTWISGMEICQKIEDSDVTSRQLARTRSCVPQSRTPGVSTYWLALPGQFSKVSPKLSKLARTQSYT